MQGHIKALRRFVFTLVGVVMGIQLYAQAPIVHDPVMIRENSTYYVFATGMGIDVWSSPDLQNWTREKAVFESGPQWAVDTIPGYKGHVWAPDIFYRDGLYYLYYSVSAFGKNTSCIGVATNKTLDKNDPEFKWVDHGIVIRSYPGVNNWNAIDPALILDKKGTPYMFFGSFWDGLKRVKLTTDLLHIAEDPATIPTVASRKKAPGDPNPAAVGDMPEDAGANAIEGPFLFKKGKYYYFFASIDYCCRGENSTYKMIVARSKSLTGTFTDKDGKDLSHGGGGLVLHGNADWYGVGHNAVVTFDGKDYLVFHGYDAHDGGEPKLILREISWDKHGWPVVKL